MGLFKYPSGAVTYRRLETSRVKSSENPVINWAGLALFGAGILTFLACVRQVRIQDSAWSRVRESSRRLPRKSARH